MLCAVRFSNESPILKTQNQSKSHTVKSKREARSKSRVAGCAPRHGGQGREPDRLDRFRRVRQRRSAPRPPVVPPLVLPTSLPRMLVPVTRRFDVVLPRRGHLLTGRPPCAKPSPWLQICEPVVLVLAS